MVVFKRYLYGPRSIVWSVSTGQDLRNKLVSQAYIGSVIILSEKHPGIGSSVDCLLLSFQTLFSFELWKTLWVD